MIKAAGDTITVILGVLTIIWTLTLIPIGLEGQDGYDRGQLYAPYEVYNETETNEESDTETEGIKEDLETETEIDANAISKLGEKDVICNNPQPERSESQQERQDKCDTTGTTGDLKWNDHKPITDAYKDPGCTSWGNYSIANANNTRSCLPQILNNVSD